MFRSNSTQTESSYFHTYYQLFYFNYKLCLRNKIDRNVFGLGTVKFVRRNTTNLLRFFVIAIMGPKQLLSEIGTRVKVASNVNHKMRTKT